MSIIDMWHEQGRVQGWDKGRAKGRKEGRKEGRATGRVEGRVLALRRLVFFKFGCHTLDARYEAALHSATPDEIDGYLQRVLNAASVAAVFEN